MLSFLVFLYIMTLVSFVSSFPIGYRSSMGVKKGGNHKHTYGEKSELEKKQDEQEKMKCLYLSKMFLPVLPKTCHTSLQVLYHEIYTYSEKKELWDYYLKSCIPHETTFRDFINGCVIIIACMFFAGFIGKILGLY
jgi:hypothetical protein